MGRAVWWQVSREVEMSERLETAIAGTRKGERWEHPGRGILAFEDTILQRTGKSYPLDGWTLVEEHKRQCPRCWSTLVALSEYCRRYHVWCPTCRLSDGQRYDTPDQAWAAWDSWIPLRDHRVSGWHKPSERPPHEGWYHTINRGLVAGVGYWDGKYWNPPILAWHDRLDVPPWVTR